MLECTPAEIADQARREAAHVQLEIARAKVEQGCSEEALNALNLAVTLDPNLAEAWGELAAIYQAKGDRIACDRAYERFVEASPADAELIKAESDVENNQLSTAEAVLLSRVTANSRDVTAMRLLAKVAARRERYAESERLLAECLRIAPGYSRARFDLVQVLHLQQKAAATLPLLDRLLAAEPDNFRYRAAQAGAYSLLGEGNRAADILSSLIDEAPKNLMIWLYYGHALRVAGGIDEAIAAYRKCIDHEPGFGEAWLSMANIKTHRFDKADVDAMQCQLQREDIRQHDRMQIEFALGQALEHQRDFGNSFAHYARGNSIRRSQIGFDSRAFTELVERACAQLSGSFFAARSGWGIETTSPIFVVGLPRSGSSLIEQILSAHSEVEGRGELPEVTGLAIEVWLQKKGDYPDSLSDLPRNEIEALATRYLVRAEEYRTTDKRRFVDKMPSNFVHLGLLHLMFPCAALIDARRHPLGCGFSCFKQLFSGAQKFSYDLRELGRYYRDYRRLMEHFDEVLPGRIHRVHYEALIADPLREVERLLNYCRLPFQPQCLRFHDQARVVHTLSAEQVRRPIYTESVEHWRNFEPWLMPLKEELGALIDEYPTFL